MSPRSGPARCRECDQPLQWCLTRERGTPVPLDVSPDPDHGHVRRQVIADKAYVDVLSGGELAAAVADGELLFTLHSKTCPAQRPFNPRPAHVQLDLPPPRFSRPRHRRR